MKPDTIYMAVLIVLLISCGKEKNPNVTQLPWKFVLTDSTLSKTYSSNAGLYKEVGYSHYTHSTFQGQGFASATHFGMSNIFRYYLLKPTYMSFGVDFISLDTALSKRLLSANSMLVKQNALNEIFTTGKTYEVFNTAAPFANVLCNYTTESNQTFATNIFNPVCKGSITIVGANIWDDGTGEAKIKVSINYNFILQAINTTASPSQWLAETRTVIGSMQTFFTVQ